MSLQTTHLLLLLIVASKAQQLIQMPPDGCIDPQNLTACNTAASDHIPVCVSQLCNAQNIPCFGQPGCQQQAICLDSCQCSGYLSSLVCAMTSCWNKAASCEYQALAVAALRQCPNLMLPPYFPPNDTDPGSCSCQLGSLDTLVEQTLPVDLTACQGNVQQAQSGNLDAGLQCGCCGAAWELSLAKAACPNNAPGGLPFVGPSMVQAASSLDSSSCSSVFAAGLDCTASPVGFSLGTYSFYSTSFPAFSSETLSNSPGSLSTPLSSSFLWYPYGTTSSLNFPIVAITTSGQPVQSTGTTASQGSMPSAGGSSSQQTGEPQGTGTTGTAASAAGSSSATATVSQSSGSRSIDRKPVVALTAVGILISAVLL